MNYSTRPWPLWLALGNTGHMPGNKPAALRQFKSDRTDTKTFLPRVLTPGLLSLAGEVETASELSATY